MDLLRWSFDFQNKDFSDKCQFFVSQKMTDSETLGECFQFFKSCTTPKPLTVDHNKLENSERHGNTTLADMPLRNLYAGQEATVRTRHGRTDWFQIGKEVCQGCILSPCLFNFDAEDIMRNAEAQAGIKIAGRNISNLRYPKDTTLMAESEKN